MIIPIIIIITNPKEISYVSIVKGGGRGVAAILNHQNHRFQGRLATPAAI